MPQTTPSPSELDRRKAQYKKLEQQRGNPLVVYVTSFRTGASGQMAHDVLDQIIEQVEEIPKDKRSIDLLIISSGGDALAAWRIIALLRSRFDTINVLVPEGAFSAATLLALGANQIVMGRYGCLGPIDPQITVKNPDGSTDQFSYEEVLSLFDFTKNEVGLTEQAHSEKVFEILTHRINPVALGFAKRASELSLEIGEKLLMTHMKESEKNEAKSIATRLNKSFFSHGHALYRKEAKKVGLKIKEASNDEEKMMWEINESFKRETLANVPFDPLSEFLKKINNDDYLKSPGPVNLPLNVPQQLVQQVIVNHIQNSLNQVQEKVETTIKLAFVESVKKTSCFEQSLCIMVLRNPNLTFNVSLTTLDKRWNQTT